ncbi:MAG: DUF1361 domain-containing protein [Ferruginibacter sp.]|nr:DUF1361 domain-containing protein [Ferruginibacter sp.]
MKKIFSPFAQWLCCCFLFIAVMIAARMLYAGNSSYLFMVWNLFLAWIPYLISTGFKHLSRSKKLVQLIVFVCWLLFFPNALYIVTDIIHLADTQAAPLWYDAVLLFVSSLTGLVLAFASVINTEKYLQKIFAKKYVTPIIMLLLFAGSFGVYLGRFERWNSRDVLHNPLNISLDIATRFAFPFAHTITWAVTFLLTGLYSLCWFLIKCFPAFIIKNEK